MPTSCCAFGCTNNSVKLDCIERKVSFHNFPHSDKYLMKAWLVKIRRQGFVPTQSTKVCSDHFEPKYFFPSRGTRRLEKDAIPTIFSFSGTSSEPSTLGCTQDKNDVLTPDVTTKISTINHRKQLCNQEIDQLSDDSQDFPAVEVETILTEDPVNIVVIPSERPSNKPHLPEHLKNFSSCQIVREDAQKVSALKNKLMSTVVKRSMKRNFLELKIKAAKAKRDLYEQKKALLPFKSTVSDLTQVSTTEQRLLETLEDEDLTFKIEKKYLKKQLIEAEREAATSLTTYYEMKKTSL